MKKVYSWIIFFLLLLLCAVKSNAQCSTSGSRNGTLFTNVTVAGTGSWNNPSNVATSNSVPSSLSALVPAGDIEASNMLYVQGFGFNIPTNAVVCGITVKIERRQQGADGSNTFVKDQSVYLLKNGNQIGSNHAFPWNWSSNYANTVHGSTSDNWGAGLTAADINSQSFGVAIAVKLQSNCCNQTLSADIDHVSLTVFYTVPLPVEMIDINVMATPRNKVNISWKTVSENNNAGFYVERSKDAIHWEIVDYLEGIGNSNATSSYSATDENPYTGISYYRIKQIDVNGVETTYDIHTVEISNEMSVEYNGTNFQITGTDQNPVQTTVLDYYGRPVSHSTFQDPKLGTVIQLEQHTSGIYIVMVECGSKKIVQKFYL